MQNKNRALTKVLALLLAIGLISAACSGEDTSAQNQDSAASSSTSGQSGDYLVDLGGREVTIAVENAYLPFNYIDAETGEPGGWDYAAIDDICGRLNCVPSYRQFEWDPMIQAVADGQFDVAADGITITEDRAKVVDFSDGYIAIEQRIVVAIDNESIATKEDLVASDCPVISQVGTTNAETAKDLVGEERVVLVDEWAFAIQALISGDACATIIDETAGQGYVGENADKIKIVGDPLDAGALGFIFPKGSDLVEPFNKAIAAMKADGTMDRLGKEYFSDAFKITYDDIAD